MNDSTTVVEKRCSKCKVVRCADQFYRNTFTRDGLNSWCKLCLAQRNSERVYQVDANLCEKRCSTCKLTKHVSQFYRNKRKRDGLDSRCKLCASRTTRAWELANPSKRKAFDRRYGLKRKYGLTQDDYDVLLKSQGGKCICGDTPDEPLHVDHDHKTGAVRGLLCGPCNRTIGMALESPRRLIALTRYLRGVRSCS